MFVSVRPASTALGLLPLLQLPYRTVPSLHTYSPCLAPSLAGSQQFAPSPRDPESEKPSRVYSVVFASPPLLRPSSHPSPALHHPPQPFTTRRNTNSNINPRRRDRSTGTHRHRRHSRTPQSTSNPSQLRHSPPVALTNTPNIIFIIITTILNPTTGPVPSVYRVVGSLLNKLS